MSLLAEDLDSTAGLVNHQRSGDQHRHRARSPLPLRAAQDRTHPRDKLHWRGRPRQEVIGTGGEAGDALRLVGAGADKHDGHERQQLPQSPNHRQTTGTHRLAIEDHQVGAQLDDAGNRSCSRLGRDQHRGVASQLEAPGHLPDHRITVVDERHQRCHRVSVAGHVGAAAGVVVRRAGSELPGGDDSTAVRRQLGLGRHPGRCQRGRRFDDNPPPGTRTVDCLSRRPGSRLGRHVAYL